MAIRFALPLIAVVAFAVPPGCSGWRIGEPSVNSSPAQGQVTGPAPAFITIAGADGVATVTPLENGTLLTAAHVLRGPFSWQLDGQDIRSLDIVRSGGGGERGKAEIYVGDWTQFRAEPFEHPGWPVSAERPKVGEIVVIRGFTQPVDVTGRPQLREVRAQVREAPWWIHESDRSHIYADPKDGAGNIDLVGMSGGPVLLQDASTGEEVLVGIFSGRMTAKWLIFRKTVWVIQPWPPLND